MISIDDHIKRVTNKLQQLLKQHQLLQKEHEKLTATVKELQAGKETATAEIYRLQQQVSILRSAVGQMEAPGKKAFEKQIDQYIREIDKCISLLSE